MVSDRKTARTESVFAGLKTRLRNSTCGHIVSFARSDEGSVTTFSLFIFLMMLFVGGMAVDLMRFETRRAALQNTLDASALAATKLSSGIEGEAAARQLVKDIMEKRGYDPNLTNVVVNEVYTGGDPNDPDNNGTLVARSVTADYDLDMNTIFMSLLGIDELGTKGIGGAKEGQQTVEISLVLDISGSMGGQKILDLKDAAKNFVNLVIDPLRTDLPVSISVIPFNHTVVVPDSLLSRLNTQETISIAPGDQAPYTLANRLTEYPRTASGSTCVRFPDSQLRVSDLETHLEPTSNPNYLLLRAISPTTELDRMAYYDQDTKSYGSGDAYARPGDDYNRRCDPTRSAILPFATQISTLETYIGNSSSGLQAGGNTSNDTGLKWGVALLDPAFRPVVSSMVTAGLLPAGIDGRPYDYNPTNFLKVLVLMTDGANTTQYDLKNQMKNGPSRVWFSQTAANQTGNWYDGYFVEQPTYNNNNRWMQQRKPWDDDDAVLRSTSYVQSNYPDLRQMTYTELYDRFSERVVAYMFRDDDVGIYSDYSSHYYAEEGVVSGSEADRRMSGSPRNSSTDFGICDAAKVNNDILVYTIAFQAGNHAEDVMQDCATNSGYYFNASNGEALNAAFAAIAGSIDTLRLTQ